MVRGPILDVKFDVDSDSEVAEGSRARPGGDMGAARRSAVIDQRYGPGEYHRTGD